nr:hypothetical protein [Tanacetum cinerariifolium]
MHDNVDDLIESALNSKLLLINSQRLNKEKQEVKNVVEQSAERRPHIIESLQNHCRILELFCQPMDQNVDFSSSDQIQTPQYPEIYPPSQEISDEVFQANHSAQHKEYPENSSNEIVVSNYNQEKEGPPQDSDILSVYVVINNVMAFIVIHVHAHDVE